MALENSVPPIPPKTSHKNYYADQFYDCANLAKTPFLSLWHYADQFYEQVDLTKTQFLGLWHYTDQFYDKTDLAKNPFLGLWHYANQFYDYTDLTKTPFLGLWHNANQFYDYADLTKIHFWVFDTTRTNSMTIWTLPKLNLGSLTFQGPILWLRRPWNSPFMDL